MIVTKRRRDLDFEGGVRRWALSEANHAALLVR